MEVPGKEDALVADVRDSLGALLRARAGSPLARGSPTTNCASALSSAEVRWRSQLRDLGAPPPQKDYRRLLRQVLRSDNTYELEGATTRRPCDLNKVKVAKEGGVEPKRIQSVCGAEARRAFLDPLRWICKSDEDLTTLDENTLPVSFTDERLRDHGNMRRLVRLLWEAGVLGF